MTSLILGGIGAMLLALAGLLAAVVYYRAQAARASAVTEAHRIRAERMADEMRGLQGHAERLEKAYAEAHVKIKAIAAERAVAVGIANVERKQLDRLSGAGLAARLDAVFGSGPIDRVPSDDTASSE